MRSVLLVALQCALLCCAADRPAPHHAAIAPSSAGDSDATSTQSQHVPRSLDDDLRLFNDFIREHGRTYQDEEKLRRFQIFRRTLYRIDRLNAESEHAVFGVNQFSDLEPWEFQRRTDYGSDTDDDKYTLKYLTDEDMKLVDPPPPDSLDYRKKGVVTPAKDQGNCSSDWAFSLTGNIEGMYALKYKRLYNLSEQLILDCTKHGCSEWNILKAIGAVVYVPGMMTEQNYPYLGRNSSECKLKESQVVVKPRVYEHWILSKEDNFRELLVARGPLSVEVAAEPLQDYKSGIINGAACHQKKPFVKQAVLLVGYGTENKIPFWILKNSWGSKWGEGGYFRIRRQVNCMDMHHNLIICVRF